jgi:GGDEF domain-containing protein
MTCERVRMAEENVATSGSVKLDAWKQLGGLLFEAFPEQPLEVLQQRLLETSASLKDDRGGPLVLIAGVLAQAMERATTQMQRRLDSRAEAMRDLLFTLLDHLESVHAGAGNFARLAQIRKHFEAGWPEDPGMVQQMLAACLSSLKREFEEKQDATEVRTAALHARVKLLEQSTTAGSASNTDKKGPGPALVVIDPCTGLPAKAEAEAALQRAIGGPAQTYVAVFYVQRLSRINARFGEDIGNEILLFCSQHIATSLSRSNDLLFRWSGPAFVAILEREESPVAVLGEVRRVAAAPLNRFFETSSRTVYLPIRLSAEVIPAANQTYSSVADQIRHWILQASTTID